MSQCFDCRPERWRVSVSRSAISGLKRGSTGTKARLRRRRVARVVSSFSSGRRWTRARAWARRASSEAKSAGVGRVSQSTAPPGRFLQEEGGGGEHALAADALHHARPVEVEPVDPLDALGDQLAHLRVSHVHDGILDAVGEAEGDREARGEGASEVQDVLGAFLSLARLAEDGEWADAEVDGRADILMAFEEVERVPGIREPIAQ